MAKNPTGSGADRLTHPLLERLGEIPAAAEGLFAYSVKIVCGKQTGDELLLCRRRPAGCVRD
jgi:hypothetical protein